ncbi:uncharacterized protein Pyn_27216 [Prunus yedoensis var. nudiflora]|uniref:DUF547 domain-containing protein n=1 Tax=Prunus yedoensis var. nudiflora TaxID=2094558 RepID=A0A314YKA5_PRUYE|nr:uncharacterized protein Pyn_27216 [Prunus yedoensis var. nudiflora]
MKRGDILNLIPVTIAEDFEVRERVPALEKNSMLRTLKDHLSTSALATSVNIEKNKSPLLSRSSTNVINLDMVLEMPQIGLAYLSYGIPHSSLRKLALFHTWLETLLSTAWRKNFGEDRQLRNSKLGLPVSEPLVCFALCTGAFSDPALYTASNVRDELEEAKKEFIKANVVVKKSRKVFLPKILERLAREASFGSDDLLKWVTENADKKLNDSIHKCIDSKSSKKASEIIEWLPYNSRFRYVFSKELSEKPWWL